MTIPNPTFLTSTKAQPKAPDVRSILGIGPGGSGKTAFFLQFPRLLVVDIDHKLDGPEKFVRSKRPDLEYTIYRPGVDAKGQPLPSDLIFDLTLDRIRELKGKVDTFDWLLLDNATRLGEFLEKRIQKVQGREVMEDRDWGTYGSGILRLLVDVFRELNKNFIVLSHEKVEELKDRRTQEVIVQKRRSTVKGQMGDNLPSYFTDAWRFDAKPGPGNVVEYSLEAQPTTLDALKNSFGMPAKLTWRAGELGWTKVEPYLKGAI